VKKREGCRRAGPDQLWWWKLLKSNGKGKTNSVHLREGRKEEPHGARYSVGASCWDRLIVINVKMPGGD
jgi:hypothetical protein